MCRMVLQQMMHLHVSKNVNQSMHLSRPIDGVHLQTALMMAYDSQMADVLRKAGCPSC